MGLMQGAYLKIELTDTLKYIYSDAFIYNNILSISIWTRNMFGWDYINENNIEPNIIISYENNNSQRKVMVNNFDNAITTEESDLENNIIDMDSIKRFPFLHYFD